MNSLLRHSVLSLFAALLLVAGSLASSANMAPLSPAQPALAAYLASGGSADDLCGDRPSHSGHDCPFCHLLADPPACGPAARAERLRPNLDAWLAEDLTRGSQDRRHQTRARAPPALA